MKLILCFKKKKKYFAKKRLEDKISILDKDNLKLQFDTNEELEERLFEELELPEQKLTDSRERQ